MSKFNKENTIKTTNRSGHVAYAMKDKERLTTAVLTTMFGEPKYYGSTDNDIVKLATECAIKNPEYLAKLACYARNVGNMRSVSHVLTAIVAHDAKEYTRRVINNVVVRPDDITEIMACYLSMYGKPFPNAMKREIANVIQKFSPYQIAKYNGGNKSIAFKDVVRITHPNPKDASVNKMFNDIINDTLETPYTWETELSAKGNNKAVWDELIASHKVGYMALLRNMKNIINSGSNIDPVLATISDKTQVAKSRQLPFRFYSAYKKLNSEGLMNRKIRNSLESALCYSVDNMEQIKGRTLIAVDVSGSMRSAISSKSEVRCCDIAALLGAMASRMCEDATVCYFDNSYKIAHYGKYDSVLDICEKTSSCGGGTNMELPMRYALHEDKSTRPFDRVIYFSDNECNSTWGCLRKTVQSDVEEYRRMFNKNFWVHGVDLQGYGTQQFCGDKFNLIAGWNDSVLEFINLAEAGISNLVKRIEAYDINKNTYTFNE